MKSKTDGFYEHSCDSCDGGWVRCEVRDREFIPVSKSDYVVLEKVPVGVCDTCKSRYYHASVVHQAMALHKSGGRRKLQVPAARYAKAK